MALPTVCAVFGIFRMFVKNFVFHFVMKSGANVWV